MEKTLKEQALEKMLEELNQPHHQAIDTLHNLLCVCDDDEVYQGILKEGKSVEGAYEAMHDYAQKNQEGGSYGMDDKLALQIVKDYLAGTSTTPDVKQPEAPKSTYQPPKNVTGVGVVDKPKPKKAKEDVNMSIFDFMNEEQASEPVSEENDDETEYAEED